MELRAEEISRIIRKQIADFDEKIASMEVEDVLAALGLVETELGPPGDDLALMGDVGHEGVAQIQLARHTVDESDQTWRLGGVETCREEDGCHPGRGNRVGVIRGEGLQTVRSVEGVQCPPPR
mgnify:CR=1 FL=1